MVSLLWYVFMWWDLVPTSPWGNLHPVPTAMLIVTISGHTVSTGNRFPWLYINCFQSPWFQCNMIKYGIFPWWVSRGGVHVFEKRRGMKKERIGGGELIHLSALWTHWHSSHHWLFFGGVDFMQNKAGISSRWDRFTNSCRRKTLTLSNDTFEHKDCLN